MTTRLDFDDLLDALYATPAPEQLTVPPPRPLVDAASWPSRYETPTWSTFTAFARLGLRHRLTDPMSFLATQTDGATCNREVWLRPDAWLPCRTAAHELAHNVLNHHGGPGGRSFEECLTDLQTGRPLSDDDKRGLLFYAAQEVEADSVAALVTASLGNPDGADTQAAIRRYVWLYCPLDRTGAPPDQIRHRIKQAAYTILSAGSRDRARAA